MTDLCTEINSIQSNLPKFNYLRPSDELIARRRLILSSSASKAEKDQKLLARIAQENPDLFKEFIDNTAPDSEV
jgi:hypothetical protein